MLLSFPEYLRAEPMAEQHIQETVNYLLSLQQPDFNFPPSIDEVKGSFHRPESEQLVHWCHGAPGACLHWALCVCQHSLEQAAPFVCDW